jgi:hypothetical protein
MSDFVLIDLLTAEAVCQYVRGWSEEDVLAWLSIFGEVNYFPTHETYTFYANAAVLRTIFTFTDKGELDILVERTAWVYRRKA